MKKIILALFFMLLTMYYGLWTISYAQETLQILTYYPAPYGEYQTIQVGQPNHFLHIDYDAGTSSYRFYPTAPNSGSILIGRTNTLGNINSDILIDGVGNIVMGSPLTVSHDGTASDLYVGGGRVGIGTNTPQDTLTVNGSIRIAEKYKINDTVHSTIIDALYLDSNKVVLNNLSGKPIYFTQGGINKINIGTNGNVGIGYTDDPPSKLAVNGTLTVNNNISIGATTTPVERLQVTGGIKIGNTIQTYPGAAGTILYNGDFIGSTGTPPVPKSLTSQVGTPYVAQIIGSPTISVSPSGGTGNVTIDATLSGGITGAGIAGYIPKYIGTPGTESATIGNSIITQNISNNINIGIGTTDPDNKLLVYTDSAPAAIYGEAILDNGHCGVSGKAPNFGIAGLGAIGVFGYGENGCGVYGEGTNWGGYFDSNTGFLYVDGNVGIGTTAPDSKLYVNGDIKAVLQETTPGTTLMYWDRYGTKEIGYDIAELFDTNSDVEPGDVLVIDSDGKLKKSDKPYDTKVAGIVSSAPAIIFEGSELQIAPEPFKFQKGTKPPVALAGKVLANISAENGPIEPGDLLTTSSTPGHAMKVKPIGEINGYPIYPQGCIIGTALEPLKYGKGKISVIVCLK